MIETIRNAWRIPELRRKMLFTVFILLIFRLGSAVPVPYVNIEYLRDYLDSMSGTIFGLINAMSGDAFAQATVFALSIQPYINSSIIIQLLTIAIPALERLQKDGGEEGKKKLAAITRYTTVVIALMQGFGYFTLLRTNGLLNLGGTNLLWAGIVIVASFTAGSAFIMWLGEQVTEFGIGNGISIILFAGIVSRIPNMVQTLYKGATNWLRPISAETLDTWTEAQRNNYFEFHPLLILAILAGILLLIIFIVFITNAERRIPVQYAKRMVGRKMYGGQSTHIPMKVNMSGVLPVIFAQSIAALPATVAAFLPAPGEGSFGAKFLALVDPSSMFYIVLYFLLILGFSYFYASSHFNPVEVANNLKKNGGFVPGFRPGKPTADFISKVLARITLFGALYLAFVAIAPIISGNIIQITSLAIGGTSVIIVVGVALETVKALEAQMLMRHYKGFLE